MYHRNRDSLPNGMRVVTVEVPHLHAAMVSLYVRCGSRHDRPKRNGVSHFLEHILFRGCEGYPDSTSLNTAFEIVGGSLNGVTTRDYGYYYTLVHPEGVATTLDVLGMMLGAPLMQDIEVEREVILEEILDEVDEDGRLVDIDTISKAKVYAGHPLSLPIAGSRKTVESIGLEDLHRHHSERYVGENLVLVVAGPLKHHSVLESATKSFSLLPRGERSTSPPPPRLPVGPSLEMISHKESQSAVRLVFPAVPDGHPDYAAQVLLMRILDDGLSSRLQQEVVERRGLAYAVSGGVDIMTDTALLEIDATTAHAKVPLLLETIVASLAKLTREAPSQEERDRAALRHRYDLEFIHDSVGDLAGWFGVGELHDSVVTLADRIAAVDAVSREDIHRLAAHLFRQETMLAFVVGNADQNATRRAVESPW